jgi:uncharacterized SAM-binding protein YcdF (DUF218 family)
VMSLGRILNRWRTAWTSLLPVVRKRIIIWGVLLLIVDCLFLILTSGPVLTWFAYRFRIQDDLVQSDAIVVLLGSSLSRSTKAAELYQAGMAPTILIGRSESAHYDETEKNRRILMQRGVSADAIQTLAGEVVESTRDEALRVCDYVRRHSIRRIVVVTTAFHTARARWIFRKTLSGLGVEVRVTACEDPRFTEADWYEKDEGIKVYLAETLKTLCYRLAY